MVRKPRSRAEVEALVAEFETSRLMRAAFCQQRGLDQLALTGPKMRFRGSIPSYLPCTTTVSSPCGACSALTCGAGLV